MVGKILQGRYEILKPIGFGGMAEVYLAKDVLLERKVAVKILRDRFARDKKQLNQFRREARSAARLIHPSIINIYDVCEEDSMAYIVMEYVEGVTLKVFEEEHGSLHPSLALALAVQLASALEHAHKHNIIHCDIKPQNIILTENMVPKIVDFGISKIVSNETMAYTTSLVGSVRYISPEQAEGLQVTAQSDLYSLGIVLYEMLTGHVPFEGDSPLAIIRKQLDAQAPPLKTFWPEAPDELQKIIDRALAKKLGDRYQTAGQFCQDLVEAKKNLYAGNHTYVDDSMPLSRAASLTENHTGNLTGEEPREEENDRTIVMPGGAAAGVAAGTAAAAVSTGASAAGGKDGDGPAGDNGKDAPSRHDGAEHSGAEDREDDGDTIVSTISRFFTKEVVEEVHEEPERKPADSGKTAPEDDADRKEKEAAAAAAVAATAARERERQARLKEEEARRKAEAERREKEQAERQRRREDRKKRNATAATTAAATGKDVEMTENQDRKTIWKRRLKKAAKYGGAVLAAIFIALFFYFNHTTPDIEVPNVVGMSVVEAQKTLEEKGFKVDLEEEQADNIQPGQVIKQDPKAEIKRKEGARIILTISRGLKFTPVPELVNLDVEKAKELIFENNYRIGKITYAWVKDKPEGLVLKQLPTPGSKVSEGGAIDLVVNKQEMKKMPDLAGMTVEEAKKALFNLGFTEVKITEQSSSKPKDTVIKMFPAVGGELSKETQIELTVSNGKFDNSSAIQAQSDGKGSRYAEFVVPGRGRKHISIITSDGSSKAPIHSGTYEGGSRVRLKIDSGVTRVEFYVEGKLVEARDW